MAFVSFPTGGIQSADWTPPDPTVFVVRNGWTGKQTVGDLGGVRAGWQLKVALAPGKVATRQKWSAFVAAMRGATGITDIVAVEADQVTSASMVSIAFATTTTATLSGLPTSVTGYMKAGMLVRINTGGSGVGARLVTLTADLNTNGSGIGTITYDPPIPAIAAGINAMLQRPTCQMRMVDGEAGWSVSPGGIYQPKTLVFEEVL